MNINDIYKLVSYMVDKYQGTYLSPDDFNMAINTAQRQYLSSILSESADIHQGGKRIKTGLKSDMTTSSSLTIFIKEAILTITSQLASHPNDMYDILAIRRNYGEADPLKKRISNESPIGKGIIGTKKGKTVTVKTETGREVKVKIVDVK